jgi:hypothetical protein
LGAQAPTYKILCPSPSLSKEFNSYRQECETNQQTRDQLRAEGKPSEDWHMKNAVRDLENKNKNKNVRKKKNSDLDLICFSPLRTFSVF